MRDEGPTIAGYRGYSDVSNVLRREYIATFESSVLLLFSLLFAIGCINAFGGLCGFSMGDILQIMAT